MVSRRKNESIEDYKKRRYNCDLKRRKVLYSLTRKWRDNIKNNPEYKRKNNERATRNYYKNKKECLDHYKHKCRCCGETIFEFLTIEHINGGGRKHREENKITNMWLWLIKNKFPDGFEILCYNCNCGKRLNRICPHEMI